MKINLVIFGIMLLLLVAVFSGCTELTGDGNTQTSEESKFVGTWESSNTSAPHTLAGMRQIDFFSDGTFASSGFIAGTYEIKDGKLVLDLGGGEIVFTFDYYFSNNGNTLTLIDSSDKSNDFYRE